MKNLSDDLASIRTQIDLIDQQIFALLQERFACAREIGMIKKKHNCAVTDFTREQQMIDHAVVSTGFERTFVEDLYTVIIAESKKQQ